MWSLAVGAWRRPWLCRSVNCRRSVLVCSDGDQERQMDEGSVLWRVRHCSPGCRQMALCWDGIGLIPRGQGYRPDQGSEPWGLLDSQQLNFGGLKREVGCGLMSGRWEYYTSVCDHSWKENVIGGRPARSDQGDFFAPKRSREEGLWPPVETVIGVLVPWPV